MIMNEGFPQTVVAALWIVWLLFWVLLARNVKTTRWRESPVSQMLHRVPLVLAACLMGARRYLPSPLTDRFLPRSSMIDILGIGTVVAGLGFAVWARWYLGPNWSGTVTLKDDHSLVRTGPYKYVRHPIYTRVLLGVCGAVAVIGEWRGVLALGLTLVALVYKSRVEERRMRDAFPEYEEYRRATAALVPFAF